MITKYLNRSVDSSDENALYPREVDTVNSVSECIATAGSKRPCSLFDNVFMLDYLLGLDPKHCPPYRLECARILEVLMGAGMMDFLCITNVGTDCLLCHTYLYFLLIYFPPHDLLTY